MNTLFEHDTQPWYRQFWPWFLITLPASVVIAGLTTVYIAHEGADDLVVDEYYKNGLTINRQLEKKQRATALGISASLEFSAHSVAVSTQGDVSAGKLFLVLSHPLEANRDFTIELERLEPGFYAGTIDRPLVHRWHWILENRASPAWRLDGSVDLNPPGNDEPH